MAVVRHTGLIMFKFLTTWSSFDFTLDQMLAFCIDFAYTGLAECSANV